jgi:thymidylate kinase
MNKKNIYCFFGIDGVGKTTITHELKKRFEKEGLPCEIVYLGRGKDNKLGFMNQAVRLNSKYWSRKKEKSVQKLSKEFHIDMYRKRSFSFLIMYYLELWARFREAKKLSKRKVVLLDRFFYDVLILTHNKYSFFFKIFTPKVKSFFLYAPYEVISKRKKEATKEGIKKYVNETEKLMKTFDITKIDASKPIKEVLRKIESEIKNG